MAKKEEKDGAPRRRRVNSDSADWSSIDGNEIRAVIAAVTKCGGAVRFGYSRDGGAYSVGIYGDGKPYTEFHPDDEGVSGWLEGIAYDFE